jgi:hypothetical protein
MPSMKPTVYDTDVIQQQADDLYSRAKWMEAVTALRYGVITFVVVALGSFIIPKSNPQAGFVLAIFAALFGALVGAYNGRAQGFHLRLQAQKLLCQRQIELNTRAIREIELNTRSVASSPLSGE